MWLGLYLFGFALLILLSRALLGPFGFWHPWFVLYDSLLAYIYITSTKILNVPLVGGTCSNNDHHAIYPCMSKVHLEWIKDIHVLPLWWNISYPDLKMVPCVDNTLAIVLCHVGDPKMGGWNESWCMNCKKKPCSCRTFLSRNEVIPVIINECANVILPSKVLVSFLCIRLLHVDKVLSANKIIDDKMNHSHPAHVVAFIFLSAALCACCAVIV